MSNSLLYATARVSSVSKNLLSQDKIVKLTDAEDLGAAVKMLYEFGYGGGLTLNTPLEYEKLLAAEESRINDYILEILPDGYGFESLFMKNDYHNAKVVAKAKYGNVAVSEDAYMPSYQLPVDDLRGDVLLGEFDKLPKYMCDAFVAIDEAFLKGKGGPGLIDSELDRAYYVAVEAYLKKYLHSRPLKDYFTAKVDLINLLNFFRCKRIGFAFKDYESRFMPTGTFAVDSLARAYEENDDILTDIFKNTSYGKFVEICFADKARGSFVEAETAMDNILLAELRKYKYDMFSVGCIVNYYASKLAEIKEVKIILACIKNGVKREEIRRRLRELYA